MEHALKYYVHSIPIQNYLNKANFKEEQRRFWAILNMAFLNVFLATVFLCITFYILFSHKVLCRTGKCCDNAERENASTSQELDFIIFFITDILIFGLSKVHVACWKHQYWIGYNIVQYLAGRMKAIHPTICFHKT